MRLTSKSAFWCLLFILVSGVAGNLQSAEKVKGWLSWRGPHQNGNSDEKNLPDKWAPGGENNLWTIDLAGQSTPVIANGKLYIMGYEGEGQDLQEGLYCLDAETGKPIWSHKFNDFLSDIIYTRYASSAPCIDPDSGNVYMQGTQGRLAAYTADGKELWHHDMMEEFGRMTFPNGRTASPVIDGDLVITTGITSNWGAHGPAAHRFYGFDKRTGELIWASQPGERPRDSSFSSPLFGWYQNRRVFWCGGGDGGVYCVNAKTGDPIWRYPISNGGVNASLLQYKDTVIAIHGSENLDATSIGRMVSIRAGKALPPAGADKPVQLDKSAEAWRNDLCAFTASPIIVGNRIYEVDEKANLQCIDADSGKVLWNKALDIEQRTSSLVYADGKLYIPVLASKFYIIKPGETGCEILSEVPVEGRCFGTPSVWNGRIYFQTTSKLYCIGGKQKTDGMTVAKEEPPPQVGALAKFLVVPAEMFIKPSQVQKFRLIGVDEFGNWLPTAYDAAGAKWEKYIPPTAKVKAMLSGDFTPKGEFKAADTKEPSAGAVKVDLNGVIGIARGRIMPDLPISENFDAATLIPKEEEPGVKFQFPPLPWIGARLKWEIRERDGNKCMVKTIDNKLFQRSVTFVGDPNMSNYTVQADVMSDGQIRKTGDRVKILKMSEVGLIHNRYAIILKGTFQQIEVNSNAERVQVAVPFKWEPNVWYTIKSRVDIDAAGVGTIRGKAWKKGDPEPEKWTIEVTHKTAHKNGAPGFFGFSPTDMPVYVDNLTVTPNK